ncbi:MAG TPA: CTP synthase [Polyangiaceae bacterium]|nr:CTP synthase [Polyangiaceae bacterium]
MNRRTKFVLVTGGVVSSIGKGLASASIGALMEARGLKITHMKLDPYINVDPGTMSPYQHGEVFVTDDGAETDLDLGHYERFTSVRLTRNANVTAGRVYASVIQKERRGEYLGATVQVIPHITDEIKRNIHRAAEGVDVAIIEVGGTVGDIESLPFLEALRQLKVEEGPENAVSVHVTLVPHIPTAGELKTKPTQHSVRDMREIGIQPDVLLCRSDRPISQELKGKIALFSNVPVRSVISAEDVSCIYELPVRLHEQGLDDQLADRLNIWSRPPELGRWRRIVDQFTNPKGQVRIGIVGKYVHLKDSYKSLHEALIHGGMARSIRVDLDYIDAEELERPGMDKAALAARLRGLDGLLVPGGFGERGSEGKIQAIRYARENQIPYFGICLGMQLAVVEFARNRCGLTGAGSREFAEAPAHPVIDLMLEQAEVKEKGGTMRLGSYDCALKPGSRAAQLYGADLITERHRHRFEVNNDYRQALENAGLVLSGTSPDNRLVEMIELEDHPYFIGCQFHPEFKSRPMAPHPLFAGFVNAAIRRRQEAERAVKGAGESERADLSSAPN